MERIKRWYNKYIAYNYTTQLLIWYVILLFLIYKIGQWIF
jgi:hypothetical protein